MYGVSAETPYIRQGRTVKKCRILQRWSARCLAYLLAVWLCCRPWAYWGFSLRKEGGGGGSLFLPKKWRPFLSSFSIYWLPWEIKHHSHLLAPLIRPIRFTVLALGRALPAPLARNMLQVTVHKGGGRTLFATTWIAI